jgi:hypothetical protein
MALQAITTWVNDGQAGSDVFAPAAGKAKFSNQPANNAKEHSFGFEVQGMAPIMMRLVIERLRSVGGDVPLKALEITGDLAPDGTDRSVTEKDAKRWLDDPEAYPKQWSKLTFPFEDEDLDARGISIRLTFAAAPTKEQLTHIRARLLGWTNLVNHYVSPAGEFVPIKMGPTLPKFVEAKRELTAGIELFERTRGPARAVLLNTLQRMHEDVLPIAAALLKF